MSIRFAFGVSSGGDCWQVVRDGIHTSGERRLLKKERENNGQILNERLKYRDRTNASKRELCVPFRLCTAASRHQPPTGLIRPSSTPWRYQGREPHAILEYLFTPLLQYRATRMPLMPDAFGFFAGRSRRQLVSTCLKANNTEKPNGSKARAGMNDTD